MRAYLKSYVSVFITISGVQSTMDGQNTCSICDKDLDSNGQALTKVQTTGLTTFILKSKARDDDKHNLWAGKSCILVHESCRKKYSALPSTKVCASKSRSKVPPTLSHTSNDSDQGPTVQISQPISTIRFAFDYLNKCVLCGRDLDRAHKSVRHLTDQHKDTLMKIITDANHNDHRIVIDRLTNVPMTGSIKPSFHVKCDRIFATIKPQSKVQNHAELANNDDSSIRAFTEVCDHIEKSGEFEFQLSTLKKFMGDNVISNKMLLKRLKEKYKDDISISQSRGRETIILYKTSGIIADFYDKKGLSKLQRKAILTVAARVLQAEVEETEYDNEMYAPPNKFLENVESDVPQMMQFFLDEYSSNKKSESRDDDHDSSVKKATISHAMISLRRPKKFISNLQLATGVYIYRKTGSKLVIDILNKLGVVTSYYSILLYEASVIMDPPKIIIGNIFVQFVFDNTGHNVATLDGFLTFHCLGGIQIFTPSHEIQFIGGSRRLKKMPTAEELASKQQINIVPIGEFDETALNNIVFVCTNSLPLGESTAISPCYAAYIWAHAYNIPDIPLFRGFFELLSEGMEFSTSYILCLPFINQPPSNLTTLNTAGHYAASEAKKVNMKTPILTMDQPLHWKFRCILAQGLLEAVARLGGFHLLMSFEGASCFIMDGSGLDDLWSTAYASESIKKMFTGHAFARALRAHILTFTALSVVICDMINVDESTKKLFEDFFRNWNKEDSPKMSDCNAESFLKQLAQLFMDQVQKFKNNGPTAKLWLQYYECALLILQFVEAERLGNWRLHLQTVKKMLPIFHAAGHFAYAKSAQVYLQDMANLELSMDPDEFEQFVQGFFTVHRTDKAWSGVWTDMIIEQTLNRFFGMDLKHGRGVSPGVVARFLLGMPSTFAVMESLEEYVGVASASSAQHVDLKVGRMKRDHTDLAKFKFWLEQHKPFESRESLISLSTGIIGDSSINCHQAFEMGQKSMDTMVGKNAGNVKLSMIYKVKPLSLAVNGMHISNDQSKSINVRILFQRLSIIFKGDAEKTKEALRYELSPFPLCLFDEHGLMRKNTKSDLYKLCITHLSSPEFLSSLRYVIDGGWLLHQIVWPHGKTYCEVMQIYANYIRKRFGNNAIVVFDGYNSEMIGIKSYERYRRGEKTMAADVEVNEKNMITMNREKFLSNVANKYQFIELLSRYLSRNHISSKIASEDADTLIVKTAVELNNSTQDTIAVVGNDIDLLILLIDQCAVSDSIYFHKIVKQAKGTTLFNTKNHQYMKKFILFAHAFSGCDSTSAMFNKGKKNVISILQKNEDLQESIRCFYEEGKTIEELCSVARVLIAHLYSFKEKNLSIHEMRYRTYLQLEDTVDRDKCLKMLPPIESALQEHVKRVYYQMQTWLGKSPDAQLWGWKRTQTMMFPTMTTQPPAPMELLNTISCGCQGNCDTTRCSCKKAGLPCTRLCKYCNGESCKNVRHEDKNSEEYMIENDNEIYEDSEETPGNCHDEETRSSDGDD
ncbi:hypothetical protein QAD02_013180 [Eretmocerus hayati]|uniref:Uncharacterized protein n=1 Tax=Eretmocerus hayati TaxID=131215 RepID=A0ACC2P1Q3_9HYME|nr:hypothetical protein QAD02_013180 [Eretmocerus hayati]